MSIKDQLLRSVTQLETDSGLVHNWAHGDANAQIATERGPVRSPAKLIADKDAEINQAANGLLSRAVSAANQSEASASTAGAPLVTSSRRTRSRVLSRGYAMRSR